MLVLLISILLIAMDSTAQVNGTFTDVRDGKAYKTVTIGKQVWMAENLAFKTETGNWAYENKTENLITYGYLYNWEAAKKSCPKGWHLPSNAEWEILINFYGGDTVAAGNLKSNTLWKDSDNAINKNNDFNVLPGGQTGLNNRQFLGIGEKGIWWSVTEFDENVAWTINLSYYEDKFVNILEWPKSNGYSVRCIKN